MSNILFALYHDFSANSAVHVHNFANCLTDFGHAVAVAIPRSENTGSALGEQRYTVCSFDEVDGEWSRLFENAEPPKVLHAWTPRENVRLFCEKVAGLCDCTLCIHLEDNEELILEANLGHSFEKIARSRSIEIPKNLANPRRYRGFIASAAGVTVIVDELERFAPSKMPKLILWPGAERQLFYPRARDNDLLISLGIDPSATVLCYTGNVHSANAHEVRSLYVAAAVLNREGIPIRLIRAGRDFCEFLGPDETWAREISVDVGHLRHVDVPELLALADVLVQPGCDDEFNKYRLPAKLPEFLAMGRPVILPKSNAGRFMRHGEDAWVLEKVDALAIVEAVRMLRGDQALRQRLSAGAITFCSEHFDWTKNAATLAEFYGRVMSTRQQLTDVTSS